VLAALSEAALGRGQLHDVIVMVDLGDLREGVLPGDLVPFVRAALRLRGVRIRGIGTNLACFGAVAPSTENMTRLVDLACQTEQSLGITLDCVSAANSSGLELIAAGHMPRRVNHARIGEAILLGRETLHRRPWPGTFQDAFLLRTEVLELRRKPSLPAGERCEDAFGKHPAFEDRGEVLHALLNIGREDVEIEGLTPLDRGITILGASSDYLVVDVSTAEGHVRVGGEIAFAPAYGALLAAMTSEYVEKHALRGASRLGGRDSRAGGAA
jgi:predicted amino acid racemase